MSGAEIDDIVIDTIRAINPGDSFSVLLGAGASAGVGLPDWNALSCNLLTLSGAIPDPDTAAAFLAAQDPALAAEAAKSAAPDWEATMLEALYGDGSLLPAPGALHLAVAGLALAAAPGNIQLFTLNFDLLIEAALQDVGNELGLTATSFTRTSAMPRAKAGVYEVHHLHGSLDPIAKKARNIVLTLSEFNSLVVETHPWQVSALDTALQFGPLILAGTSYRDADIRSWLHGMTAATKDRVVVFLARQGLGLDREQFLKVQKALEQQWTAIGVQPIITQDHADAAQALKEIPHINSPGYKSPQERTVELWEACMGDFAALQLDHSKALEDQLSYLSSAVGLPANLVLWIADGKGNAARWAGPDRIYKDSKSLRLVPTGHDSPWIVGQCFGSNEVIAEDLGELSEEIRRWKHVAALPVTVERQGGPPFTFAVITAALTEVPAAAILDDWIDALQQIAQDWSNRLSAL